MTHVERYHAPLRVAFNRIKMEDKTLSDSEALEWAVKAVNDTVGPEGLTPTLLVFGSVPRPARNCAAETQIVRARAIDAARNAVEQEYARRKVSFGLKYKGPFGRERKDLQELRYGAAVGVYRRSSNQWEQYRFVEISGDTVTVQGENGRRIFRSSVVKPWESIEEQRPKMEAPDLSQPSDAACRPEAEEDPVFNADSAVDWTESREREISGLQEQQMFEVVPRSSVPEGTRIFGTRWVDTMKSTPQGSIRKSRLVAQNYNDKDSAEIPTRAPTISKAALRVVVATAASMRKTNRAYLRDITQAYTQAESALERAVYLEAPPEMKLSQDHVLLCLKPLYGIPESGLHWFVTYSEHHRNSLRMRPSRADKCLFVRKDDEGVSVTALQVDDSFGHGTQGFLDAEDKASTRFKCKPRKILSVSDEVTFNGCQIRCCAASYRISQAAKLRNLSEASTDCELVSVRAAMQYIATSTRPDLAAPCQLLASKVGVHPDSATYRAVNRLVRICHETADDGLNFTNVDMGSCRIVVFTDASFANAEGYRSQLGFVICVVDDELNANIVHFGSQRCKRVTRSVMAAELHALIVGFDNALIIREILNEMLGREIHVDVYIDSKTVFDTVTRLSATLEKRLQIDAFALQESHLRGELRSLLWIPSEQNCADALTKESYLEGSALRRLMATNKLEAQPTGWVQHIPKTPDAQ
jgi:hypothetical protein